MSGTKSDMKAADAPIQAVPTTDDLRRAREMAAVQKILAQHDAERAKAPKITLVCTSPFTLVTDDEPSGVVIDRGQEFEISTFDLHRFVGRGFPRAIDAENGSARGVSITTLAGPRVE